MDFKGISWAGNIYQKFENMCLEVEEVMYEDTVKYVENQAQRVGASVKKFCSEVMADLNSPSFVDPVKVAAGELSLNPYAHSHTDINKKTKSNVLDTHGGELMKKENENKVVSDITMEKTSLNDLTDFNRLCANNKNLGIQKRRIGIKRLSQNNRPPKVSSHAMKVTPSSGSVVRLDPGEPAQENKPAFGAPDKSSDSDKILSTESVRQKKDHSECTSSCHGSTENIGTSVKEISVSQPDSSVRTNNAREVESFGKDAMVSKEGKVMKDGSSSQLTSNIRSNKCGIESEGDDVIVSYEDSFDVEAIENAEVVEPRVQVFEPVEKSKLEETCVLVEGDNLQFVSHGTHKPKSYKKKIREAISSKLRSTKKKDECIPKYKDLDGNSNKGVAIGGPQDSSESDWELL